MSMGFFEQNRDRLITVMRAAAAIDFDALFSDSIKVKMQEHVLNMPYTPFGNGDLKGIKKELKAYDAEKGHQVRLWLLSRRAYFLDKGFIELGKVRQLDAQLQELVDFLPKPQNGALPTAPQAGRS